MRYFTGAFGIFLALTTGFVAAQPAAQKKEDPAKVERYEMRADHDPNGIGKFYMGREIAHVMSYRAPAGWSGRRANRKKKSPS